MTTGVPSSFDIDPSLAHLLMGLGRLEGRVRRAVDRRRTTEDAADRFAGLYVSEADVDRLLANGTRPLVDEPVPDGVTDPRVERWVRRHIERGADLRLIHLEREFGLSATDIELLLIALAPDVDGRFERLFGYLQDDVTRRRASVGLALELCGFPTWSLEARSRLAAEAPLVRGHLLDLEDTGRPFLSRSIRVPDRVIAHLLGSAVAEPAVSSLAMEPVSVDLPVARTIVEAIERGSDLVYLVDRVGAAARAVAAAAFKRLGRPLLSLDLTRAATVEDLEELPRLAVRDARLAGAGLVAGPIEALSSQHVPAIRALADADCPVVLVGHASWEPGWSRRVPLIVEAPVPTTTERRWIWEATLDASGTSLDEATTSQMAPFRLNPDQVMRATTSAVVRSRSAGRSVGLADLQAGARAENAAGLGRLARRVEPHASWADLVLPDDVLTQLRELTARARFRDVVIDDWGMGGGGTRGRGVTGLFAGDPGTGKTMSAEVVAAELGLDLYVIDLSTVVDKYIGETEKNLDRIFAAADGVNGVLLFDEADALFGKRSEVRDARDRYANVEIAYLLQRMETFDGLALLTTNLRSNLDEAFARRLDALVDFPMPEEADRLRLWEIHLPNRVPRQDDIDLPFLAARFRISGGNIRNICFTAAFLAAEAERAVGMADLIRGTEREYRKLGRMTVEEEFGDYIALIRPHGERGRGVEPVA